ncbi:MAG: hypothetical protein IT405_00005, partial [Candidatus Yanofskybacteria bacterium]|nr:hypothetical protein [Candidatus Yanofskybacteria bacterium]
MIIFSRQLVRIISAASMLVFLLVGSFTPQHAHADTFTLLHEFAGGASDGNRPYDSLIISGSTLYGMTSIGGDSNAGTIFSVGIDGTGFTLLHEFA